MRQVGPTAFRRRDPPGNRYAVISPKDADWGRRREDDGGELPPRTAASQRRAMQAAMTAAVLAMRSRRRPLPPGSAGASRSSRG